jgi:hypothetical protein
VRALVLAVVVLVGLPGVAGAAPTPGDYGGGDFAGRNHLATWMWARVDAAGNMRINAAAQLTCGIARIDAQATLAPDGSFRVSRLRVKRELGHVLRSNVTLSGRFDGALATGTIRARVRDRTPRGAVQRCAAHGRPWKLHLRPAAGAPGPPQSNGEYLGLTSQAEGVPKPFILHVNRRATRVGIAIFEYTRVCRRGGIALNNFTPGAPIRPDGTFALRDRFTLRFRGGVRERFRIDVDGRFAAGGVGGTLRATTVARRRGRVIDRCDTGQLSFAALL